jgi:DUF1680 family protein
MFKRVLLFLLLPTMATWVSASGLPDYPIQPVPFTNVEVGDGFWLARMATNREVTVWYDFRKCEETGRIANFARAGGLEQGGFQGIYFNDSDVMKVIEGAAYCLALEPDHTLDRYLDDLIVKIAAAQEEDGYLYTARTIGDPTYDYPGKEARWSHLGHGHELYNAGHLYEAAVAHFRATGKRALLEVALRNADLVCEVFGPQPGQRIDVPGHEEIELGLVKLYRVTGEEKYLRQARFFIDMRGRKDKRGAIFGTYAQDHRPFVEQTEAVGHAVRGGYLYAGAADVAALTGDAGYIRAIDRIWEDVVRRKLYLIGSVGQHGAGEGYAGPWKLDNLKAYNETCAAIALALWNHRMFLLHGDARYADVLERILYNGFLAGVSLSGDRFFYPNPLACDMKFAFNHGSFERSPWFGCSCCPVNVVRFLPSIPGMVYAHQDDAVYVNQFLAGTGRIPLPGNEVTIRQHTDYPWNGVVRLTVTPRRSAPFELRVRMPGWAQDVPLPGELYRVASDDRLAWTPCWKVNGALATAPLERGYAVIRRIWRPGDVVELDLPMKPHRILAHHNVVPNRGRVAVARGPLVYCAEGADHDGHVLHRFLPDAAALTSAYRPDLLGGVTVVNAEGAQRIRRREDGSTEQVPGALTLVPYYAWCHRGPNEMQVWMPRTGQGAVAPLPPTLASRSRASASHTHGLDHVGALNDQCEPATSADHEIPRHTWWDHRGTTEWVQYDLEQPATVSAVEVYWFDDTGRGSCRVPASWKVLYRSGGKWEPVRATAPYGLARDRYNHVGFAPVTTEALRIQATLRPGFSGGILEWKVTGSD